MSIAKVVHIVSSSNESFDDAIKQGLASAAQTLHGISGIKVTDWTASVQDNRITTYKVTMDIAFAVDR